MANINPIRYPVDYTGTASTNKVFNELVTLQTRKIRVFSPAQAPFFKTSMVITDVNTGLALTSSQWNSYFLIAAPSAIAGAGNEVYGVVVITDQSVSNNLKITYQTVGGDFIAGFDSVNQMLSSLSMDNRPVTWDNIFNRPSLFNPSQHLHPLTDTLGYEFLASALQQLTLAVQLGDDVKKDFVLNYVDLALANSNAATGAATAPGSPFGAHVLNQNNPHVVTPAILGLGNVMNYALATLSDVYAGIATNKYVTADQVASAVHNAVNLGMDAHIANFNNPHQVTAQQINLGLILNVTTATLAQLNSPNAASPLYVTNVILAQWLSNYFAAQATSLAATVQTLTTSIAAALQTAQQAQQTAQGAQQSAQASTQQSSSALVAAQQSLAVATSNTNSVAASQTAAVALIAQYTTAAVAAADTAGYQRGYAAGIANASHS